MVTEALRANIVSWDSGGLSKDIDLLTDALTRIGADVRFKGRKHRLPRNKLHSWLMTIGVVIAQQWSRAFSRPSFDINIFVETVFPEYLPTARVNALFVNPEWFRDQNYEHLGSLDFMLCKTADGYQSVRELDVAAKMVGFTSPDKQMKDFVRDPATLRCLHLSGQSALKGSESVIEAWAHHPEWPELTVVRRAKRYGGEAAPSLAELPNVCYLTEFVPNDRLRELQNECEVHVIPSLAEGYGHVIGEAMSCAAVVVTTDAPPMNELVGPDRGLLVNVERTEAKDRSTLNYVSVADLERKLESVFSMSPEERHELGQRARKSYEAQQQGFYTELRAFLDEALNWNHMP